ncbi:S6 family peptidase [Aggregatibacter kilianii]|uniref:S6 family peptidase n=1 Tax=Aggregatibacter kilianii TaxID=2025884 RepID=UPI000D655E97|nr:S6 family peptidase [Aggregatibacter kilianii]
MKKTIFKPNLLTLFISSVLTSSAFAGHVRSDVDYQYFRDFAENKGKFTVGASNIEIFDKSGNSLGLMMKNNIPMLDLAVLSRSGVGTLVGDQYIISVAHNSGYGDVDYGAEGNNPDQKRYSYKLVNRNDYPKKPTAEHPLPWDYHQPRLNKFVTEVAPIDMIEDGMHGSIYNNRTRYPMRVRAGTGIQKIRNPDGSLTDLVRAYNYLTGGNAQIGGGRDSWIDMGGDLFVANDYGPMPIVGDGGDSGSPIFIYDANKQKWFVNGVLNFGNGGQGNTYSVVRPDYFYEILERDSSTVIQNANPKNTYLWRNENNGNSTFSLNGKTVAKLGLANNADVDHGKNITFVGYQPATVELENSINQGAGGLYFQGDFTVRSKNNNDTWLGSGISISEDSTVNWQVKNPKGDRLSKIGVGTLEVNGTGENLGDISVGDGKVILNQTADANGKQQAFANVQIVSGRPTVTLAAENQVNPDNISFGFRGGRLDVNGHDLTFNRIQNTDEGARIVNHNKDKAANITILGNKTINKESDINQSKAIAFNGWFGETDSGLHNGELNLTYAPTHAESQLLLSGSTNLKGNITQKDGTLVLSGRPTPHAYNHLNNKKAIDYPKGEVIFEDDWLNRTFNAEKFIINGGSAVVSRNVSEVRGDWQLSNNASATLGVADKQENFICQRSDWTGLTTCSNQTLSDKAFASIERTQIKGNFTLNNTAKLSVLGLADVTGNVALNAQSQYRLAHNATQTGTLAVNNQATATVEKATLKGDVTLSDQAKLNLINTRFDYQIQGSKDTQVSLSDNANWTLPSSTTIGNLNLDNSQITLNPDFTAQANNQTFNTLTVQGDLSGNGTFNYRTYLQENKGDHVAVNGLATGNFVLNVRNTGSEPQTLQELSLLTLKNAAQTNNVNVSLGSNTVDLGAYRYELKNDNHDYRLYNPKKEQELAEQARLAEEKRKAEEAARIAEEKRKAEEAARLEEEKRKAEEAARLAEEKRKAEEAARLAEEKRKAEEAARLAEEKRKAEEAARLAEEKRKAEEAARLAEEKRKAEEAARLEEEKRKAEEAARLAEEKRKAEEVARLAEEKRKAEEAARLAEEKRKAEETARLAEEKRKAEEEARLAEEKRKAEEAARLEEEKRKAEEAARLEEEKRKAEEAARLAEEKRKAEEAARLVEEKRKAEETARLEEEKRKNQQPKQKELISRYSNSALSELSATVNSALLVQEQVNKHLESDDRAQVWANTLNASRRYDADEFRAYKQKTYLNQVGVQHIDDRYRMGLLFSHAKADNTFDDNISSKNRLTMLSVFGKYDFENGLNVMADAGYGISAGEIRGESQDGKMKRHVTSFGVGIGYKLNIHNFSIKPNVSVHRYFLSSDSYSYDNVYVHSPSVNFNAYQAGVTVDYAFMPWQGVTIRPLVSVNYVDASDSKLTVQVNQVPLMQRFDRYWQQEIGVNAGFGGWQIGTYASQSRGKQLDKQRQLGLKVGYRW